LGEGGDAGREHISVLEDEAGERSRRGGGQRELVGEIGVTGSDPDSLGGGIGIEPWSDGRSVGGGGTEGGVEGFFEDGEIWPIRGEVVDGGSPVAESPEEVLEGAGDACFGAGGANGRWDWACGAGVDEAPCVEWRAAGPEQAIAEGERGDTCYGDADVACDEFVDGILD
jgi:hypothetical protein